MIKSQPLGQNLYQIPNCTICLVQMQQDIASLNCGHCFHHHCITQQFQYRGTCPNCQKRSIEKQIRKINFPLVKSNQSILMMKRLLGQLDGGERQQMTTVIQQYRQAQESNHRLLGQVEQYQKEQKKLTAEVNQIKTKTNKSKMQHQQHRKTVLDLKQVVSHLQSEIVDLKAQNFNLNQTIQRYKDQEAQYEKMKKIQKIMHDNSASLIKYKNQLQSSNTSDKQMARLFFDLVMTKNLDVMKFKQKIQRHPQILRQKNDEIEKLKASLQKQMKLNKEINESKNKQKTKLQQLKIKYKRLLQKYRSRHFSQDQNDNFQDSCVISRPILPQKYLLPSQFMMNSNQQYNPNNLLQKSIKIQQQQKQKKNGQTKQEINQNMAKMQNTLNRLEGKSMVNGLGTYGGFHKKADGNKYQNKFSFNNKK